MAEKQIDIDARRISNEIVFGKLETANEIWKQVIKDLKQWEVSVLRDKIKASTYQLDAAKADMETKRNLSV